MPQLTRPRVLFLNDVGFQYGAGVALARQVQSFLLAGSEVGCIAWEPANLNLTDLGSRTFASDLWLGFRRVRHLDRAALLTDEQIIVGLLSEVSRFNPDAVIVGNLHCAQWPLELLGRLQSIGVRTIAYMHDAYLVSGRCAYPGDCQLFLTGCNATCPTAEEYPPLPRDQIAGHWTLRRRLFSGATSPEIVTNSHWTRDLFRAALPVHRSCETVYLAADETVFRPGDKTAARQALGLPPDKPLVLCAAVNFQERRKGTHYLREIIEVLKDSVTFAAFGHNSGELESLIGLGYHTDAATLAKIYQAADIFLGTATEEAFGQTIMEAQLCGVPVVAFQVGGVSEIVRNEITGKLIRMGNVTGLISAIRSILGDPHVLYHSGVWARRSAVNRFSLGTQAQSWNDYLEGKRNRGTGLNPPSLSYPKGADDANLAHRPSWPINGNFISAEHTAIFEQTSHLPGWQMPGDSFKLYEMAYHSGDVILEIGTYGGRSATVELRGALANPTREVRPQFYGVDIAPESIARTRQTLSDVKLIDYCHLFEGTFTEFSSRWSVRPTMVFLDGDHRYEGAAADMTVLSQYLDKGVPILIHDYLNPENDTGAIGVRRATHEWLATGKVRFIGCFGCTALVVTQ